MRTLSVCHRLTAFLDDSSKAPTKTQKCTNETDLWLHQSRDSTRCNICSTLVSSFPAHTESQSKVRRRSNPIFEMLEVNDSVIGNLFGLHSTSKRRRCKGCVERQNREQERTACYQLLLNIVIQIDFTHGGDGESTADGLFHSPQHTEIVEYHD